MDGGSEPPVTEQPDWSDLNSEVEARVADAAGHLMVGHTALVVALRRATIERMGRSLVFGRGQIVEN